MELEIIPPEATKKIANFPESNIADIRSDYRGPSPYHLNYCGFEHCKPGFRFGPAMRRSYLLHLVIEGRGIYRVGEKVYSLAAGDMFLIYPGDVTIYQADEKEPWVYYWIGFNGHQAEYLLSEMGYSRENHTISVRDPESLTACVREMLRTHQINLANELKRESLLLDFLSQVIAEQPQNKAGHPHAKAEYAKLTMQYLTNNYMHKIRISDIADFVGVDRSYLSKSFQAEYKMSPQAFLLRLRMWKATDFLKHSDEPIAAVAARCGYPDALAFSRIFRQHHGCSPTEYRAARLQDTASDHDPVFDENQTALFQ